MKWNGDVQLNGVVDSRGKNVQEAKSWWRQVVKFIQLNKEDLTTQVTKGVKLDDEKWADLMVATQSRNKNLKAHGLGGFEMFDKVFCPACWEICVLVPHHHFLAYFIYRSYQPWLWPVRPCHCRDWQDELRWAISGSLAMMFFEMQLVELKNGETYNGHLVNCDTWMNIHLREVICTSKVRMLFMTIACVRNLFIL